MDDKILTDKSDDFCKTFQARIGLLEEKYANIDESDDDVIDLENMIIVKDTGALRKKKKSPHDIWFSLANVNRDYPEFDGYITEEEEVVSDSPDEEFDGIAIARASRERVKVSDVLIDLVQKDLKESRKERRAACACRPPRKRRRAENWDSSPTAYIPSDPLGLFGRKPPDTPRASEQSQILRAGGGEITPVKADSSPKLKITSRSFQFGSPDTSSPAEQKDRKLVEFSPSGSDQSSEEESCWPRRDASTGGFHFTDSSESCLLDDSSKSLSAAGCTLDDSTDLDLNNRSSQKEVIHSSFTSEETPERDISRQYCSWSDSTESSSPTESPESPHSTPEARLECWVNEESLRHAENGASPRRVLSLRGGTTLANGGHQEVKELPRSPRTRLANSLMRVSLDSPRRYRSAERPTRWDERLQSSGLDKCVELSHRRGDNSIERGTAGQSESRTGSPRSTLADWSTRVSIHFPRGHRSAERLAANSPSWLYAGREDNSAHGCRSRDRQRRLSLASFRDLGGVERRMSPLGRPLSVQCFSQHLQTEHR